MQFPPLDRNLTGVAVPVSSLKSDAGCGTGEFYDLIALGTWCREAGIDLIQILPVQDSGHQTSPYSALSAYALHPLYLRLHGMPEADAVRGGIDALMDDLHGNPRLDYARVLEGKLSALESMYRSSREEIAGNRDIARWIDENGWVRTYAAYRVLKQRNGMAAWWDWPELRDPETADIDRLWEEPDFRERALFYAWIQFRADEQLSAVSGELADMGVLLKGDLPILINPDSADVWAHRDLFELRIRAGAPPDMFSAEGQNWGFPTYNWEAHERDGFSWWRDRLRQASRYFHAYRLDHVIGFFRIWGIPENHESGIMGRFIPYRYLERSDLREAGLDEGRIAWLSRPHLREADLADRLGDEKERTAELALDRINDEPLFTFRWGIGGEKGILSLPLSETAREYLLAAFRDRALIPLDDDRFFPAWSYESSSSFRSLPDEEKDRLKELFRRVRQESEKIWEEQGRKILSMMKHAADMLPCAEDLGDVPDCVPPTLEETEILSLKIPQWSREWKKSGSPYVQTSDYPFLSVCTPSVHDTETLRGWWKDEEERRGLCGLLQIAECSEEYDPQTAETVLRSLAAAASVLVVYQIQEYFALTDRYREATAEEGRINVPGTHNDSNWSYRIRPTLEELAADRDLIAKIRNLTDFRRSLPVRREKKAGNPKKEQV